MEDERRIWVGSSHGGWLYLMGLDPLLMETLVICAKVDRVDRSGFWGRRHL